MLRGPPKPVRSVFSPPLSRAKSQPRTFLPPPHPGDVSGPSPKSTAGTPAFQRNKTLVDTSVAATPIVVTPSYRPVLHAGDALMDSAASEKATPAFPRGFSRHNALVDTSATATPSSRPAFPSSDATPAFPRALGASRAVVDTSATVTPLNRPVFPSSDAFLDANHRVVTPAFPLSGGSRVPVEASPDAVASKITTPSTGNRPSKSRIPVLKSRLPAPAPPPAVSPPRSGVRVSCPFCELDVATEALSNHLLSCTSLSVRSYAEVTFDRLAHYSPRVLQDSKRRHRVQAVAAALFK